MQKIKALIVIVLGVILTVPALADEKIAVLDVQRSVFASSYAQSEGKSLEESADFVALVAKLEGAASDFQALAKELEEKRLTWSSEQIAEHQKKMTYKKEYAELANKKVQTERQQLAQRIMQKVQPKLDEAVKELIEEEGITILLRAEATLFRGPDNDITAKVADRLNKKMP